MRKNCQWRNKGGVTGGQGLTQLFFESQTPDFAVPTNFENKIVGGGRRGRLQILHGSSYG